MSLISFANAHGSLHEFPGPFMYIEIDREIAEHLNRHNPAPHRHAYHEFIWIQQGSVTHQLDGESIEYNKNTMLCIPKGRIHRLFSSPDCKVQVIKFKDEFFQGTSYRILSMLSGKTALQLNSDQAFCLETYLAIFRYEYAQTDPNVLHTITPLLTAFINKLESFYMHQSDSGTIECLGSNSVLDRFNRLLEENFKTEHRVYYYASKLGVSTRKLGEITRLYLGKNPSEIIDDRLIAEAKRMILSSEYSIKEIAYELGFEEHSYFTKVFKRLTGGTPSDFKPNYVIDTLIFQAVL